MTEPRRQFQVNAADEAQVKAAGNRAKSSQDRKVNDMAHILSTKEGRRFLWALMGECRVNGTVWEPSAKIHYNAGQQDIGHMILAQIIEANPQAYIEMMIENSKGN